MNEPRSGVRGAAHGFPTTQWSLVLRATQRDQQEFRDALDHGQYCDIQKFHAELLRGGIWAPGRLSYHHWAGGVKTELVSIRYQSIDL